MRFNIMNFFRHVCTHKNETECEINVNEVIDNEISCLLSRINDNNLSETELNELIGNSFRKLEDSCPSEVLDEHNVWPVYVKLSFLNVSEPIEELVMYVNANNYRSLTKRMTALAESIIKKKGDTKKDIVDKFVLAVYTHIVNNINSQDVPCCLALGKIEQQKGNYQKAREWYERVTTTAAPYNGITATLASYEEEIKELLADKRGIKIKRGKAHHSKKIHELNMQQLSIYEKWSQLLETKISDSEGDCYEDQKYYVSLMTRYARLVRKRGEYKKAIELLERIPDFYPEIYRVYVERAMICQDKSIKNGFFDLDMAVDLFQKAETSIEECKGKEVVGMVGLKSILMPLANTYFELGKLVEAEKVCDRVLDMDTNEQKAIRLKSRILFAAS